MEPHCPPAVEVGASSAQIVARSSQGNATPVSVMAMSLTNLAFVSGKPAYLVEGSSSHVPEAAVVHVTLSVEIETAYLSIRAWARRPVPGV